MHACLRLSCSIGFLLALILAGCDRHESSRRDRGKVDVQVDTPGGNYGVHVDYPKGRDHDHETKVKVDHD